MSGSRGQPPPQLTGQTQPHATASSQAAAQQGVGVRFGAAWVREVSQWPEAAWL